MLDKQGPSRTSLQPYRAWSTEILGRPADNFSPVSTSVNSHELIHTHVTQPALQVLVRAVFETPAGAEIH